MAKYRKKPIVVDAIQFRINFDEISKWVSQWHDEDDGPGMWEGHNCLIIDTLEGEMEARNGDWIIRGIEGEFYPRKKSIFEATYEKV